MHVLIVNFNLKGIDDAEYTRLCQDVAPVFAAIPGLATKLWIRNADTGTYGGVYLFESRDALNRFQESDLFRSIAVHKNFTHITADDFEVLEAPTRVTGGVFATVAS